MPGWVEPSSPDIKDLRNVAWRKCLRTHACKPINLTGRLGDATLPSLGEANLPRHDEASIPSLINRDDAITSDLYPR